MTLTRKWSLLTAIVVVAVLAAGWFLLVSPKRSEAAELQLSAADQVAANDRLVQKIEVLKAQQADLPAQRALLARLQTQLPDNPSLPRLVRDLTAAGRKVGVTLDSLAPAPPEPIAAPVVTVPVAPPVTDTEAPAEADAASGDSAAVPAPAPAPVVAAPSLYKVPVVITVSGSYFELEQYINKLEGFKRSLQVVGFTLAASEGDPSSAAAGEASDLTLSLQSRVFISVPAAPAAPITPVATAPASE